MLQIEYYLSAGNQNLVNSPAPHRLLHLCSLFLRPAFIIDITIKKWQESVHRCEFGYMQVILTDISDVDSSFLNLNRITYDEEPATASLRLSGHNEISWIENGSSSIPSILFDWGFSNIFAVFNLYSTCSEPALASQNFILPSACLQNHQHFWSSFKY